MAIKPSQSAMSGIRLPCGQASNVRRLKSHLLYVNNFDQHFTKVDRIKTAYELPANEISLEIQGSVCAEACLEVAFQHSPSSCVSLFDRLISDEQVREVRAALIGIRAAVSKRGFTTNREASRSICLIGNVFDSQKMRKGSKTAMMVNS